MAGALNDTNIVNSCANVKDSAGLRLPCQSRPHARLDTPQGGYSTSVVLVAECREAVYRGNRYFSPCNPTSYRLTCETLPGRGDKLRRT
jgi:hypothetical protein